MQNKNKYLCYTKPQAERILPSACGVRNATGPFKNRGISKCQRYEKEQFNESGGVQRTPLLSTKKGIIFDGPFFCGEQGRKMRSIFFFHPHPNLPLGEGFVASCRSSEGACGSGGSFVRAAVCSGARFGCAVAGGRWLAPRGWVRVWCLYLCGRNGSVFRDLMPLRRLVIARG